MADTSIGVGEVSSLKCEKPFQMCREESEIVIGWMDEHKREMTKIEVTTSVVLDQMVIPMNRTNYFHEVYIEF